MADEDDEDDEDGGGGTSLMMLGGVGLVGLLLGGGAGFAAHMFLFPAEECEEVAVTAEGEAIARPDRAVHSLSTFTVNLRGTGGGRVLRMEVQLEVDGTELPSIEEQSPVLRDAVLTLASDYTYADLEGIDGKMRFRDELMSRLNGVLSTPSVKRIYFTKFVVQ